MMVLLSPISTMHVMPEISRDMHQEYAHNGLIICVKGDLLVQIKAFEDDSDIAQLKHRVLDGLEWKWAFWVRWH